MGAYENIGLRKVGIEAINFINYIRVYGLKNGCSIFLSSLIKRKGNYIIKNRKLGSPYFLRSNISDKAMFQQMFLDEQYKHIISLVKEANYIIDAGGNIGLAARYFHIHYPNAQIISIEPDDNNIAYIEKNVAGIESVKIVEGAIWYKSGEVNIANPEDSPSSFMVNEKKGGIKAYSVNDLLQQFNWPYIDIFKIDIEGAEKELFENNYDSWIPKVKSIIIELHDNYKNGAAKAFVNAISSYNFEMYTIHENIFIVFKH